MNILVPLYILALLVLMGYQVRTRVGFKDLPIENFLEISSYLAERDRLYLALRCESLLEILDSDKALQRSSLFRATATFPDEWMNRFASYKARESPGWKLLGILENSRWRRCFGCFKLHPRAYFEEHWLKAPVPLRVLLAFAHA